jgi:thymidine kinase
VDGPNLAVVIEEDAEVVDVSTQGAMFPRSVGRLADEELQAVAVDVGEDIEFAVVIADDGSPDTLSIDHLVVLQLELVLSREDVLTLCDVCDSKDVDVFCFGLKTDTTGNLFEGSRYLLALADNLNEIQTPCEIEGCNCNATCHIRYINGVRDTDGRSVAIETGDVTYKAVCRKHWRII